MVRFVELFRFLIYLFILEKADSVSPVREVLDRSHLSNRNAKCRGEHLNREDCSMALRYFKRYSNRFLKNHNLVGQDQKEFSFGYAIRPGINQSLPLDLVMGTCLLRVDSTLASPAHHDSYQASWNNLKRGADRLFEQCVTGRRIPIEGHLDGNFFRISFMTIIPIPSREITFSEHERARLIAPYKPDTGPLGLRLNIPQLQKELRTAPMLIGPQSKAPSFYVKDLSRDRESQYVNCDTNSGLDVDLKDCQRALVKFRDYKNRFLEHHGRGDHDKFCFGFEPHPKVDHYMPLDIRWGTCLIRVDVAETHPHFDGIVESWDSIFQGVIKIYEQCIHDRSKPVEGDLVDNAFEISITRVIGIRQDHRIPPPFRIVIPDKPLMRNFFNDQYDSQDEAGPSQRAQTLVGAGNSLALPWRSPPSRKQAPSGIRNALTLPPRPPISKKSPRKKATSRGQAKIQGPDPRSTYDNGPNGLHHDLSNLPAEHSQLPPELAPPPPVNDSPPPDIAISLLSDVIPETESDEEKWYGTPEKSVKKPT